MVNQLCSSSGSARSPRKGSSIVEFAFFVPWYLFLFAGALDVGIFSYSLIASQSAARVAAVYCSTSAATAADTSVACSYALDQFRNLPNVGAGLTTCGTGTTVSASAPVAVTAASITGPDNSPATEVTVIYLTPQMIPIPGVLPGQLTITRTAKIRIRG